jgi:hypothetical protein
LPEGIAKRLVWKTYGENLRVGFIHRFDPTDDELLEAARWAKTHDPSDGFFQGLKWFLEEFGYGHLVPRI